MTSPSWDPRQYLRFEAERARPWYDLLARLADLDPTNIVDLGCGPGHLTVTLADRWHFARIEGIDSSPEMIKLARSVAMPGRVQFTLGDIAEWSPAQPLDLIVSNAALQWLPDHLELLQTWVRRSLAPGGALAFQVPANRQARANEIFRAVAGSPRWADRLGAIAGGTGPSAARGSVREPREYAEALAALGCAVDVWETTYIHVLDGDDPVLEWFAGTGLRPYLDALGDDDAARDEFRAELAAALREAYPRHEYGTLLPFRRVFGVARVH